MDAAFWDPSRLARVEERRQALGTAECADDVLEVAGGTACFAGVGSWVNQAAGQGLNGPVSDDEVGRLVDFFVARGVEPKIEVASSADPSLLAHLAARGFVPREFEHILARPLPADEDLQALLVHPVPPGLTVTAVERTDEQAVTGYARLVTRAFFGEGEEPAAALVEAARRVAAHARVTSLLAHVDGQPAAGGQLELFQGEAALIGAAVLTPFRRRGIQQRLTVRRLELAREQGATWACVHARPGIATERSALRFGFRLAYTKVVLALPGEGLQPSP